MEDWLANKTPAWGTNINYILLFDPGNQAQYKPKNGNCTDQYNMSIILRSWLTKSPSNSFVILSGKTTADDGHHSQDGKGHAGIQDGLFPAVKQNPIFKGRDLRKQIIVCNYDTMEHWDVWINFRDWMNKSPITKSTCPVDPRTKKRPKVS